MGRIIAKPWLELLKLAGITVAVYCVMRYILPIVIPFFIAVILAVLLHPLVTKIEKKIKKIPRGIISLVVLVLAVGLVIVPILLLFYMAIRELCIFLSEYPMWADELNSLWCGSCDRIEAISGIHAEIIEDWGNRQFDKAFATAQNELLPFIMDCSVACMKNLAGLAWHFLVTMVAAVLILADYKHLKRRFAQTEIGCIAGRIGKDIMQAGGTYVKAQLTIMLVVSGVCIAGLYLTKTPYAFMIGIGIGFCDALPFLGTGTVFVPWLIFRLLQGKYFLAAAYGVIYIICCIIREYLEPRLVGKGMGVHPLAIVFCLYVGIRVYGAAGVILGPLSGLLIWELMKLKSVEDEREYGD